MKKILIPTDFSDTAANALNYGLHLAKLIGAKCALLHCYEIPYDFAAQLENRIVAIRENAEKALIKLEEDIHKNPEFVNIEIERMVEQGDASSTIAEVAEAERVEFIVMGLSHNSKLNDFMFGNTSAEVIEKSEIPVLNVPADVKYSPIKEFVYASDYKEQDLKGIKTLTSLARLFSARIRVIHITKKDSHNEHVKFSGFIQKVEEVVDYPFIVEEVIDGEDVEEGLLSATKFTTQSVICMSHYKKSLFEDLFTKSHTKTMAYETKVPLLVLYDNMNV